MPLNLASPGVVVREVDLTAGRIDPTSDSVGGIVAPFAKGPVEIPTTVQNENDLLDNFGKSYGTDKHFESWLVASSFLAYGGSLRVVRSDDDDLKNSVNAGATAIKIKSIEHYDNLGYDENTIGGNVVAIAKNPGSWGNGIRVGVIDSKCDQVISAGTTSNFAVGYGITQSMTGKANIGVGATTEFDGYLKGIVCSIGSGTLGVKVLSHVTNAGVETSVDYQPGGGYEFGSGYGLITAVTNAGVGTTTTNVASVTDYFDAQKLATSTATVGNGTTTTTINWNNIADRPGTSDFAAARGSRFDEVHVVVIDGDGKVTGNAGTVLEKHLSLSKAKDAEFSAGSPSYWRKYLKTNSEYIFGGKGPGSLTASGFKVGVGTGGYVATTDNDWDQDADGIIFGGTGTQNYTLTDGVNYDGTSDLTASGALSASVAKLATGYKLFESDTYAVDFLLMGSGNHTKSAAQALAEQLISVADLRKDSLAFISPYRTAFLTDTAAGSVTINNDETITTNVLSYYASLSSSSYAIFDSGYKYMYDRFNNTFRYVPLNGDIAGTCARTDSNQFPWYSPAGTQRGSILNAVKLAYNPNKSQRDKLYSARINPVIFSAGSGIILFGDKTGLAKSSAFDRINVRRLFIFLENAIEAAAKDQLFEFNDEITRTNFINIVDPFLRDVQAKRGIQDYVLVCDETNNTAAVIDNNEFIADIYIKPARSINFIGLTFVATRTGVSFEEVIGNV